MKFINGVSCQMQDDGTTYLTLQYQFPGMDEPEKAGCFIMSETTALLIAQAINDTSKQKRKNQSILS